jgi:starch synthase
MASAELWPVAKVGGLADAVGFLARALVRLGHEVRCALPGYRFLGESLPSGTVEVGRIEADALPGTARAVVRELEGPGLPAPLVVVEHPLLERTGIYEEKAPGGEEGNRGHRWAAFCRAVWGWVEAGGFRPEVVHAHDHQAAPLLGYLRWAARSEAERPVLVFTIHNLGYQGIVDRSWIRDAGLPETLAYPGGPLEYFGRVNLMKIGIEAADMVTTVSPRYAEEIRSSAEFGMGLEGVLARRADRLVGILNGVDTDAWNPAADPHLRYRYGAHRLQGKGKNRAALRAELRLARVEPDRPILAFVGRLVEQKGVDLLLAIAEPVLGEGVELVVLGAGESRYEAALGEIAARWPGRCAVRTGFDEPLAHRIYAGADLLLMPSRYEPCGLGQMYALLYGTIPVVRAVGGLADTVVDVDEDPERGNGFLFRLYEPPEFLKTVRRAIRLWRDRAFWRALVRRAMASEFSWERAARLYVDCYERAGRGRSG